MTMLSFLLFASIVRWALLAARNKPAFDEAQQLPFLETGADHGDFFSVELGPSTSPSPRSWACWPASRCS